MYRPQAVQFLCLSLLALAVLGFAPDRLDAQTTIGSFSSENGHTGSWGTGIGAATFGQTFVAPSQSSLDSFSFWLGYSPLALSSLDFRAYVYGWDVGQQAATGNALYTGGTQNHTATPATAFTRHQTSTGGLVLNPGASYVAFLSTVNQASTGVAYWELNPNEYAGGEYVYQHSGNTSHFTGGGWNSFSGLFDLRFEARFSDATPVPEPSGKSLVLVALAGFLLSLHARRRRVPFSPAPD